MNRRPGFPVRLDGNLTRPAVGAASAGQPRAPMAALRPVTAPAVARSSVTTDSTAVRARMVRLLAGQGVNDPQVLAAMGTVERHRFVDTALAGQAYEDTSLPIGLGQTISKPGVVARMIELLAGGRREANGKLGRVLEVGTGCGYQAAVLAMLASEVYSIERLRGLHERARANLRPFRIPNVHLLFGDGMVGYAKGAPYAGIIAAAGGESLPQTWIDQLAVGGRIVAPSVLAGGKQALVVVEKAPDGVNRQVLEAVHFVPLKSGTA